MFAPTWRVLPRPAFDVETEAPCGTSVAEAREALAFWRTRLRRLPWYRRAARAEARAMVARWQRRVVQAELERWRLPALARPLPRRSTGGGRAAAPGSPRHQDRAARLGAGADARRRRRGGDRGRRRGARARGRRDRPARVAIGGNRHHGDRVPGQVDRKAAAPRAHARAVAGARVGQPDARTARGRWRAARGPRAGDEGDAHRPSAVDGRPGTQRAGRPPVATRRLMGGAARAKASIAVSGGRAVARVPATSKSA